MNPKGSMPPNSAPQPKTPLGGFRIVDTSRAEEAEHILSSQLSRLQIQSISDRSHFRLQMNGASLGSVFLGFNRFGVHTRVNPGRFDETFIFSFGYEAPSLVDLDGRAVVTTPTSAAMLSPFCRPKIERSAGSGMFLVRTSAAALEEHVRSLTGGELREPLHFRRQVDLSSEPGSTVRRIVRFTVSELEAGGSNLVDGVQQSSLQDLLLGALLLLPNNHSDVLSRDYRGQISPRLVRVAEDFLKAQTGAPVSIADLLAICGCSRSVLFEAFSRYRNYTPMQFLMDRRLDRARSLLMADPDQTVTSIAYDCGFRHLGRFAGAYRKRFGETPSETLGKNRRIPPQIED